MLKISVNTNFMDDKGNFNLWDRNGFGYGTYMMMNALDRLGYEITHNDKTADVEMWFESPRDNPWYSKDSYKISYFPWESSGLPDKWRDELNRSDEVWTPSHKMVPWLKMAGIEKPLHVYEHGVDTDTWEPVERKVDGPFRFLHVGGEAIRKGVRETLKARRMAFGDSNDVEVHLKIISENWNIPWFPHVFVHNKQYDVKQLFDIFASCHAYVYPSYGEGFGLTPLQAMATGMPTICTAAWAPYEEYLDPDLALGSKIMRSPHPQIHPGNVFIPNFDELVENMKSAVENYDQHAQFAHSQIDKIKSHYDWTRLTEEAFARLETRLENS